MDKYPIIAYFQDLRSVRHESMFYYSYFIPFYIPSGARLQGRTGWKIFNYADANKQSLRVKHSTRLVWIDF